MPPLPGLLIFLLIVLSSLAVITSAQETTTSSKRPIIGKPTDTMCIQVICPSSDAASIDPPSCPDRCKDDCKIVPDVCCENQVIAVCSGEGYPSSGTTIPSSTSQPVNRPSSLTSSMTSAPSSLSVSPTHVSSGVIGSTMAPPSTPTDSAAGNVHEGATKLLFSAVVGLPAILLLLQA
ncbi:hypothetical protein BX666DRAFT_1875626 [Dichotomocladium elegans]|nr:hypothetical protein BX666DRAFT_1875626 [Dichotomocladium elegans]